MIITQLTKQKRSNERFNVYLDNKYYCALTAQTIVKNKLKENDEITLERIDELAFISERETALLKAVNYLGSRLKTKKQIINYLKQKGYVDKIIEFVLDKLQEYKYIDDENYVECFIRASLNNKGKRRIAMELRQKGVDEKLAKEKTCQIQNEYESVKALAEKYLKNKVIDNKTANKLYRYLAYRGFSNDDIIRIIKEQIKEELNESRN